MTGSWEFWDEDPAPESRAHLSYYTKGRTDSIYFHDSPGETRGLLFADALNVHEATGLTPSQLQDRVAELEAALSGMVEFFQPHAWGSGDNRADALREARKALGVE